MFSVMADVDGVLPNSRQRGERRLLLCPTRTSQQTSGVDSNTVSISQRRKLRQEKDTVIAQGWRANKHQGWIRIPDIWLQMPEVPMEGAGWLLAPCVPFIPFLARVVKTQTGLSLLGREARPVGLAKAEKFPSQSTSRGRNREVTSGLQ